MMFYFRVTLRCLSTAFRRLTFDGFALRKIPVMGKIDSCLFSTYEHSQIAVKDAYKQWLTKFKETGVTEPMESLGIIMAHVLGNERVRDNQRHSKKLLSDSQIKLLNKLCECRMSRMPVQYIIGEWQFRNLKLSLTPPVFIPRPETETLVELVLEKIKPTFDDVRVLEVGCGSGAVSLALAQENPKVTCTAIDQSELACRVAKKNAIALNLEDRVKIVWAKLTEDGKIQEGKSEGSEAGEIPEKIDILVSNPPYVPQKELFHLQPEILLYEDLRALDGGKDGLKIVKPLLNLAANILESPKDNKKGGMVFIEVDSSHPDLIKRWLTYQGNKKLPLNLNSIHKDLFGKYRFVELCKI